MGKVSKEGKDKKVFKFENTSTHSSPQTSLIFPFNALKNGRHLLAEYEMNRPRVVTRPFNF